MLPRRRDVVCSLLTTAAAAALPDQGGRWAFAAPRRRKLDRFGVILGSVNKALAADPPGTLKRLARLGFKELELAGPPAGLSVADFKTMIADEGLVAMAGGAAMHQLKTDFAKQVEKAHAFGLKYLVCYWPWSDDGKDKRLDDWKQLGATLNELGAAAKKEGLVFAYHNHDHEFVRTDGGLPYDVILAETAADLVTMELDIYWMYKGGQDATKYVRQHPGRFSLFHVKDMDATPAQERVCLGAGRIPFSEVLAAVAEQPGEKHYFWEHEGRLDAAAQLACATRSAKYMKRLRF